MTESPGMHTVLSQFISDYHHDHRLTPRQHQVCHHINQCRTPALGGLSLRCEGCGFEQPHYHSCRDRHCPRCQWRASKVWSAKQQQKVLPVTYYHLVFTLPHDLNGWVQRHPEVIYRRLFQSVWATLKAFGKDPKRLGGQLGMTAVLHTWGQTLTRHIHLHCLVPGGVLTEDSQWRSAKGNYLFPVRALSRGFRGRMVSQLRKAAQRGELDGLTHPGEVDTVLDHLMQVEWAVYGKNCLSHTDTVVEYLARYSHRIAISNGRIVNIVGDQVRFRYKDYRDHNKNKVMALDATEFIRRFLLHVLPKGLMRIRHYGWQANRCREKNLERIRSALAQAKKQEVKEPKKEEEPSLIGYPCPKCQQGQLQVMANLLPVPLFDSG